MSKLKLKSFFLVISANVFVYGGEEDNEVSFIDDTVSPYVNPYWLQSKQDQYQSYGGFLLKQLDMSDFSISFGDVKVKIDKKKASSKKDQLLKEAIYTNIDRKKWCVFFTVVQEPTDAFSTLVFFCNDIDSCSSVGMFENVDSLSMCRVIKCDTSECFSLNNMFKNCRKLSLVDLQLCSFEKLESICSCFEGCVSLEDISLPLKEPKKDIKMGKIFHSAFSPYSTVFLGCRWNGIFFKSLYTDYTRRQYTWCVGFKKHGKVTPQKNYEYFCNPFLWNINKEITIKRQS